MMGDPRVLKDYYGVKDVYVSKTDMIFIRGVDSCIFPYTNLLVFEQCFIIEHIFSPWKVNQHSSVLHLYQFYKTSVALKTQKEGAVVSTEGNITRSCLL